MKEALKNLQVELGLIEKDNLVCIGTDKDKEDVVVANIQALVESESDGTEEDIKFLNKDVVLKPEIEDLFKRLCFDLCIFDEGHHSLEMCSAEQLDPV